MTIHPDREKAPTPEDEITEASMQDMEYDVLRDLVWRVIEDDSLFDELGPELLTALAVKATTEPSTYDGLTTLIESKFRISQQRSKLGRIEDIHDADQAKKEAIGISARIGADLSQLLLDEDPAYPEGMAIESHPLYLDSAIVADEADKIVRMFESGITKMALNSE